jgi:hypothetical protein
MNNGARTKTGKHLHFGAAVKCTCKGCDLTDNTQEQKVKDAEEVVVYEGYLIIILLRTVRPK